MPTLNEKEMFTLGFAYASFAMDECDQGIHTVLPTYYPGHPEISHNSAFKGLFEDFFNKIPAQKKLNADQRAYMHKLNASEGGNDCYCRLYQGAIVAWCFELDIDLGTKKWLEDYDAIVKLNR